MAKTDSGAFGALLRRHRQAAGFSQEELAAMAGLSVRGISDLERGARHTPQRETVRLLVGSLGLSDEEGAELEAAIDRRRGLSATSRAIIGTPVADADVSGNNLPAQLTSFIGRGRELEAVGELLHRPGVRLVTLTGAGGTGKTRLALRVAEECSGSFPDGVWFVDLSAITGPDLVVSAIAQVLGVREAAAQQSTVNSLETYLRDKRLLLVLDNFEQILEAASVVANLLESCTGAKVLVTSRAALRVSAEHLYPVPPLDLPDPERSPKLESLSSYESVRLFIERAQAVSPHFGLTNENAQAVADICARLDGLPLAIELAAARVRLFDPEALLSRLGDRLKLLSGGPRDAPARQRTLRATIDWSYSLLSESERTLLCRLSAFSGGFTLEAAEAVCTPEGEEGGDLDVLGGAESLLDNSLLRRLGGKADGARLGMLETVREYATERLEQSGEAVEVRRRHVEYFLALAEEAEPELRGPGQVAWLLRLEAEIDNLRAALSWALAVQDIESVLRMFAALWRFWVARGRLQEWDQWMANARRLVASDRRTKIQDLLARALVGRGLASILQDETWGAEELRHESLRLCREVRYRWGTSVSHMVAAWADYPQGEMERAGGHMDKALALAREEGDPWLLAIALQNHGLLVCIREGDALGEPYLEESLRLARAIGDAGLIARALNFLGLQALHRNEYARVRALGEESLGICRELRDIPGTAAALGLLTEGSMRTGDYETARRQVEEVLVLRRRQGDRGEVSLSMARMAWIALELGDPDYARRMGEKALESVREYGDKIELMLTTYISGRTLLCSGEYSRAEALFEENLELSTALDYTVGAADALTSLGWTAYLLGDLGRASVHAADGLAFFQELGHELGSAACLEVLGSVEVALEGSMVDATHLFAVAESLRESVQSAASVVERTLSRQCIEMLRATLGQEAFGSAWAAGRSLTMVQATELAARTIEAGLAR